MFWSESWQRSSRFNISIWENLRERICIATMTVSLSKKDGLDFVLQFVSSLASAESASANIGLAFLGTQSSCLPGHSTTGQARQRSRATARASLSKL